MSTLADLTRGHEGTCSKSTIESKDYSIVFSLPQFWELTVPDWVCAAVTSSRTAGGKLNASSVG